MDLLQQWCDEDHAKSNERRHQSVSKIGNQSVAKIVTMMSTRVLKMQEQLCLFKIVTRMNLMHLPLMPLLRLGHQSVFKIVMVNLGTDVGIQNAIHTQKKNVVCLDFVHTLAH